MAALFMVTSLAAAAAALILLIREDLAERFGREYGNRYLRRLGLLAVLAVGVWILVIGKSARAFALVARMPETAKSDSPKKLPILPSGFAR
ncbi:MAG: hypothetical protein IJ110_03875 [Lachnospiraceae bacterium]|nr:hypothetical protein [Lachnospiraceae bacterium]